MIQHEETVSGLWHQILSVQMQLQNADAEHIQHYSNSLTSPFSTAPLKK